jgi:hypothetical protein
MLRQLYVLAELLAHLLAALLTAPAAAGPHAPTPAGRAVVGTLWEVEVVFDLAESDGATDLQAIALPDGSFAVCWR